MVLTLGDGTNKMDNINKLAELYNEQFYLGSSLQQDTTKVNINAIRYERLGADIWGNTIIEPVVRVSCLCKAMSNIHTWQIEELKWEGKLSEWYKAISAKLEKTAELAIK